MDIPAPAGDSADSIPTTPILEVAPARWRIGTFRSLRHRNYRLYFIGQVISLTFNVARAIGPALGAITYTRLGPGHCFLLNALSYVAVLIGLAMMDVDGRPAPRKGRRRSSLGSGLRYLASHWKLLLLLVLS